MADKREWPKSYVIPSVVLSLTAAGLLVLHVIDSARHIDAWAVMLLVVGFDSVPGSGGLRIWRGSRVVINESC
jgi:hypothetical protein